jgi:hypothetical protein
MDLKSGLIKLLSKKIIMKKLIKFSLACLLVLVTSLQAGAQSPTDVKSTPEVKAGNAEELLKANTKNSSLTEIVIPYKLKVLPLQTIEAPASVKPVEVAKPPVIEQKFLQPSFPGQPGQSAIVQKPNVSTLVAVQGDPIKLPVKQ